MSSNNVQFTQPVALPQTAPVFTQPNLAVTQQPAIPECINTSSIITYITQYWWVIVALILAFLYYRQSINKSKKEKEHESVGSSSV